VVVDLATGDELARANREAVYLGPELRQVLREMLRGGEGHQEYRAALPVGPRGREAA
jgi:hypothetical protein